MKNKFLIICLVMLFITGFSNFATGQNFVKNEEYVKYDLEIISITEDNIPDAANNQPYVEITYPPDGSTLDIPYLEVLGFAYDQDGMDFMEWTYEFGSYQFYDNDTLGGGTSYGFRIRVFDLLPGAHTVTVYFYDVNDNVGSDSVTVYYGGNNPPDAPNKPEGPEQGSIDMVYTYSTNTTDPESDTVRYGWDWDGDSVVDQWTGFYDSEEIAEIPYSWNNPGIYTVQVKAEDDAGAKSAFSPPLIVEISDNTAPGKPNTPMGSSQGRPGISYSYSSFSFDSEGHRIYYMFDWDDGTDSDWMGPYESGDVATISHVWQAKGTFQVKVKAKDDPNGDGDLSDGIESVWSDPLEITMPRKRTDHLFNQLLSKFPLLKNFFLFFD